MSYNKSTWQTGDVVTAQKLNNMENGIANAVVVLHETDETLDKTWAEIKSLLEAGTVVVIVRTSSIVHSVSMGVVCNAQPRTGDDPYAITEITASGVNIDVYRYVADTEDDFPVLA